MKMKFGNSIILNSIFKTFFLSLCIIANVSFAYAQTAAILPPAKTTFFDQNGKPLTSGTVDFYIPGTTTRKTTWQDSAETIPNTNPVVLDSAGRAIVLGDGIYRQIVKDRNSNLIWDQVTSSVGSGGGTGGGSTVGDGDAVGTIKPWAGIVAPSQYQFAYGQALSRTTYSALKSAITISTSVTCTGGSPILTSISDTSSISVGAAIEVICASSSATVISKTSSTVTLNINATISTNATAVFFPYGNGDALTTFNAPDLRGYVLSGRCNMGGVDCSVVNSTYFSSNINNTPSGQAAKGGSQSKVLGTSNLPPYTPSGTITGTISSITVNAVSSNTAGTNITPNTFMNGTTSGTPLGNITFNTVSGNITGTLTGVAQGGASAPFGALQPTQTINYIVKVTPDSASSSFNGVQSIGGMSGVITCGTNLSCSGNNIDTNITSLSSNASVVTQGTVNRNLSLWANEMPWIEDFGGSTALADNTPALNAAYTSGANGVKFKCGVNYSFGSAPTIFTRSFRIVGCPSAGPGVTGLYANYIESTPTRGFLMWTDGFVGISDVYIVKQASLSPVKTGGAAISIIPSASPVVGTDCDIHNVRISAGGTGVSTWNYSLYLDGSALSTPPLGLRTCHLVNVDAFGATTRAAYVKSVVHFSWLGGAISQAGGTDGSLEVTGTGAAMTQESTFVLDSIDTNNLILDQVKNTNFNIGHIAGSITNTANTTKIAGQGRIDSAPPQSNWTASSWQAPESLYMSSTNTINWGGGNVTLTVNQNGPAAWTGASVGGYSFDNVVYPTSNRAAALGTSASGWQALYLGGSTSGIGSIIAPAVTAPGAVWTLPSVSDTIAGVGSTQTLTSKTLTAPVINSPTGIVKSDVGLGNVPNVDTTNASNISSGTLAVGQGGVDQTAWSSFTPTLSCDTGSLTTASASAKYKQIGKVVFFSYSAQITTNGTCATSLRLTLPVTPVTGQNTTGNGKETALSNNTITNSITTGVDNLLRNYTTAGAYTGANGSTIVGSITYAAN